LVSHRAELDEQAGEVERQRRQLTGAAATQAQLSHQEADLARRDRDLKVRRQSSLLLLPLTCPDLPLLCNLFLLLLLWLMVRQVSVKMAMIWSLDSAL